MDETTRSAKDGRERGRAARAELPRSIHGEWAPDPARPDPVQLLDEQNRSRVPWLVPLRHARMSASPFAFYRGTARIMAADLARTPTTGLDCQLGGDAHLSNFGAYASPERRLVFDANDFDETLRGPWEWDVKRLACSFTIAGENLGFSDDVRRELTALSVQSYREAMADFASMGYLQLHYDILDVEQLQRSSQMTPKQMSARLKRFRTRARGRTSLQALRKLTTVKGGRRRIRSDPPVLMPVRDLPAEYDEHHLDDLAREALRTYGSTLSTSRRWLLERYEVVDVGVKVVGVGSVGTRCLVALLMGRDDHDPLFLQIKEASESVLEEHLDPSPYPTAGQRVVEGQRMVQAQSDIFLGWTSVADHGDYYVRQLRDWKGSANVDRATPKQAKFYARLCGRTLARGHARSGDAGAIAGYCGNGKVLDRALVEFSARYARQNRRDFEAFRDAIADGRAPSATS